MPQGRNGATTYPSSMRPQGHRVKPLRRCNVCRACPASPFGRLSADAPHRAWRGCKPVKWLETRQVDGGALGVIGQIN